MKFAEEEERFREKMRLKIEAFRSAKQAECDQYNAGKVWKDCAEAERLFAQELEEEVIVVSEYWGFFKGAHWRRLNAPDPEKSVIVERRIKYKCKLSDRHCGWAGHKTCAECNIPILQENAR